MLDHTSSTVLQLNQSLYAAKELASCRILVFRAASEVVTYCKPPAKNLKWFLVIVFRVLHFGASK